MIDDKFEQQQRQYEFPYHHIPYFDNRTGAGIKTRSLGWGLEYLCYLKHIQEMVLSLAPASLLDVGCGDGRFLGLFDQKIKRRVGVDLVERAVRFAKAFYPEIEFYVCDASDLNETFDVVVSIEVLEHVPDEKITHFLQTLSDRIRPGGHLILSVPTKVAPLISKHYRHYDYELLMEQIRGTNLDLELLRVDYVHRQNSPLLLRVMEKLIHNRFWVLDLIPLRLPLWRYLWEKHRFATPKNGRHLVVLLRKREGKIIDA